MGKDREVSKSRWHSGNYSRMPQPMGRAVGVGEVLEGRSRKQQQQQQLLFPKHYVHQVLISTHYLISQ